MKNGNGMLKIEKGVPPPTITNRGSRKYPWDEMEVGDSFLFPTGFRFGYEAARTASQRRKPKKFVSRVEGEEMRCWRIV